MFDLGLKPFERVTVPECAFCTNWQCVGFTIDSQEFDKVRVHLRKIGLSAETPDRARSFDVGKLAIENLTGKLANFPSGDLNFVKVHAAWSSSIYSTSDSITPPSSFSTVTLHQEVGESFRFWPTADLHGSHRGVRYPAYSGPALKQG
ncbi:hypothetical protein ACVW17_006873 [Bradyrhizobium sp. USDA 4473]